jgi:VanZ family protein
MSVQTRERLRAFPFVLAIAASAILILSAPFIGELRSAIRARFPGHFVTIVGAAVALATAGALVAAMVRIRDRRPLRYGLIAAALVLAVVYSIESGLGNPESDVVERFHFIEYGVITLLFYRAWRPLGDAGVLALPVLAGLAVGTCDEWFQWFIPARIGEMRDVFLNLAAIISGLLFSLALDPPDQVPWSLGRRSLRQIAGVALFTTVLFAAFVDCVHIGYAVGNPEIGWFRSIYTASELEELWRDRRSRWASAPPLTRPPRLSREDQYMSEGLWHVQARNRAWSAGDIQSAWYENRILEQYFAPVLDTPSYVSKAGHRWSPEQHADAERRANLTPGQVSTFVSHAQDPFPIFVWSRVIYWVVIAAIGICLLGSYLVLGRTKQKEVRRTLV